MSTAQALHVFGEPLSPEARNRMQDKRKVVLSKLSAALADLLKESVFDGPRPSPGVVTTPKAVAWVWLKDPAAGVRDVNNRIYIPMAVYNRDGFVLLSEQQSRAVVAGQPLPEPRGGFHAIALKPVLDIAKVAPFLSLPLPHNEPSPQDEQSGAGLSLWGWTGIGLATAALLGVGGYAAIRLRDQSISFSDPNTPLQGEQDVR